MRRIQLDLHGQDPGWLPYGPFFVVRYERSPRTGPEVRTRMEARSTPGPLPIRVAAGDRTLARFVTGADGRAVFLPARCSELVASLRAGAPSTIWLSAGPEGQEGAPVAIAWGARETGAILRAQR